MNGNFLTIYRAIVQKKCSNPISIVVGVMVFPWNITNMIIGHVR